MTRGQQCRVAVCFVGVWVAIAIGLALIGVFH